MTEAAAPRGGDVRGRIALRAPHVAPAPLGPSHVESRVRCAFDRARKGGYHSNQSMVDLEAVGIRSCIAEPDRGRRDWSKEPDAQRPVIAIVDACAVHAGADCAATRRAERPLVRASLRHRWHAALESAWSPETFSSGC